MKLLLKYFELRLTYLKFKYKLKSDLIIMRYEIEKSLIEIRKSVSI